MALVKLIQATEVEQASSLSLWQLLCSRIVFLCFHSFFLALHVLFTSPSLLTKYLFCLFICFFNKHKAELSEVMNHEQRHELMKIYASKSHFSLKEKEQIASKFNIRVELLNNIFKIYRASIRRFGRKHFGELCEIR